jgi:hypothetical protein
MEAHTMATLEYGTGKATQFDTLFTNDLDIAGMDENAIRAAVLADAQLHITDVTRATPTRPVLAGRNGRVYVGFANTPKNAPQRSKASPADIQKAQGGGYVLTVPGGKKVAPQPADIDAVAQMLFAYGAYETLDAAREAVVAKQEERKAQADALLAQMDSLGYTIKSLEADLANTRGQYADLQAQLAALARQP